MTPLRITSRTPRWQSAERLRHGALPPVLADWLLDRGSLTRRLQLTCSGRFQVELVGQRIVRPSECERRALGLAHARLALVREVRLCCDATPWVFARTVIPLDSLRGPQRRLRHIGTRPLGAILFADPCLRRGPVEVARLGFDAPLLRRAGVVDRGEVWGRRSLFWLGGAPLLVSEFFLPMLATTATGGKEAARLD